MSKKIEPSLSLLALPVELHHRVFDFLDSQTLLFSVRNVCTQLNAVVHTYTRYNLHLTSISKYDFRLLWNLVRPEYILSLTLSNEEKTPGQIGLFLSLVDINKFSRLRSLVLFRINTDELEIFLKHATNCCLTTLIIKLQIRCLFQLSAARTLLSSVLAQPTLRTFQLSCPDGYIIDYVIWPLPCSVRHLITSKCTFRDICEILQHLSSLQILEFDDCYSYGHDISIDMSFTQITSLILTCFSHPFDDLKLVLSSVPSLIHFKLTNHEGYVQLPMSDGSRWEYLIQSNLPLLTKFEFYLCFPAAFFSNPFDCNSIIARFQSPFWLEKKHWIVAYIYIQSERKVFIYSIPSFKTDTRHEFQSDIVSSMNITPVLSQIDAMDTVGCLKINLTKSLSNIFKKQAKLKDMVIFCNTTILQLRLDNNWSSHLIQYLSSLVDLLHLHELKLCIDWNSWNYKADKLKTHVLPGILKLLEQACNIHTLSLSGDLREFMITLYPMLPPHIKHLVVDVYYDLAAVQLILKNVTKTHLFSISFKTLPFGYKLDAKQHEYVINFLTKNDRGLTFWKGLDFLHIWLDTENNPISINHEKIQPNHHATQSKRIFRLLCSCTQTEL